MKKKRIVVPIIITASILAGIAIASIVKFKKACTGLCSGCNGCNNQPRPDVSYYMDKKADLIRAFEKNQRIFQPLLAKEYDARQLEEIVLETKAEFVDQIDAIPYIGGDDNQLTEDIEQAAMVLAFYKVQKAHGKTTDEIGTIITESIKTELYKVPGFIRHFIGGRFFTKNHLERVRAQAFKSQKRQYKYDWVTEYVESDGSAFDYGFNHIECGIVKYLSENGALDIVPYLCSLDFIYSDALGEGLMRTTTIAEDGTICDFRFKRVE